VIYEELPLKLWYSLMAYNPVVAGSHRPCKDHKRHLMMMQYMKIHIVTLQTAQLGAASQTYWRGCSDKK